MQYLKIIERSTIYDVSPFPRYIEADGEKTIYVSQKKLAWGAYDEDGRTIMVGSHFLASENVSCGGLWYSNWLIPGHQKTGYRMCFHCISQKGKRGKWWDLMPYCMHFFRGYALHGSYEFLDIGQAMAVSECLLKMRDGSMKNLLILPGGGQKGTRVILDSPDDPDDK